MTNKREKYIKENTSKWIEQGELLYERREKHCLSLRDVANLLGTSATRIRKVEKGEPVSMAEHLIKCYNLLFDHLELHASFFEFYEKSKWRG